MTGVQRSVTGKHNSIKMGFDRMRQWFVGSLGLIALHSCTVAVGLTSNDLIEEIDEIVQVTADAGDPAIDYAEQARVSSWYMHNALLTPVRRPIGWLFGRREELLLKNPGQHVRELLKELPDEVNNDLIACSLAASRFAWFAELDRNPQTRILAIDGLARICESLQLTPFAGSFVTASTPLAPSALADAREGIRTLRPTARSQEGEVALDQYRDALALISGSILVDWDQRILLVEQLSELLVSEPQEQAKPWLANAVRRSIEHCVRGILLGTISDRSSRWSEVRLCAMEQVRRLGGPRSVPFMLATMVATPQQRAATLSWFDPDPLIQLRLIHYCGQLGGELANTSVHLPGRQDWEAPTPNEFLATTALSERDYYSKLRTPAIIALSWSLQRKTIDPDPEWVRAWNEQRR